MPEDLPPEVHVKLIKPELKRTGKELDKADKKLIKKKKNSTKKK